MVNAMEEYGESTTIADSGGGGGSNDASNVEFNSYANNTMNDGEGLFKIVTYHPSTISHDCERRKRHVSQPGGISHPNHRPRRPQRSIATMEGMIYDPLRKEFRRKPMIDESNERRLQQQFNIAQRLSGGNERISNENVPNGGERARLGAGAPCDCDGDGSSSTDQSAYIIRCSSVGNRSVGTRSVGTRSVGTRSVGTTRSNNVQHKMSVVSMRSFEDATLLPPSTAAEKRKMFRSTLTTILSCMYAILIFTLGVIIFFADLFLETPLSEAYSMYLIIVGFIYLSMMLIDIRIFVNKAKKYHEDRVKFDEMAGNEVNIMELAKKDSNIVSRPPEPPVHEYCFSAGRHAGSFFLKVGAAAFCFFNLIHSSLFLYMEGVYKASDLGMDCGNTFVMILYIMYPVYSFCQLFFIFKYSNVIILKMKGLARFALMHCISGSLCFWVWTIIRETVEALKIYARKSANKPDGKSYFLDDNEIVQRIKNIFNLTALNDDNCTTAHNLNGMVENVFPYLYPFSIEYSILIVGVFYILWSNIGNCNRESDTEYRNDLTHDDEMDSYKSSNETENCKAPTAIDDNGLVSNLTVNIDCHSSIKGWLGGLLILVLSMVSVIVSYVALSNKDTVAFGVVLKDAMEIFINMAMLIAAVVAYYQIKKLDVNPHPISKLDDLLLFVCIPAFFIDACFTMVPAIIYSNYTKIFCVVTVVVQVLVQTPLVIDALRRCSNSRALRRSKPGRELVAFLIACNVACWLFETLSPKNADTDDERYDFYGKAVWTILRHVSLPLSMFYRFHSSVCLADVWKAAYAPGNKH